jgi:lysylphosphatidylglycerol synthetase-like protein (DUF2156 family)
VTPELQRHYLLQYGSQTNACFHFQPGLRYFHLPGVGFLSYHLQRGLRRETPLVFVKPLCADADLPRLLRAFLAEHGPAAIFLGMDAAAAAALGDLGFSVNEFGVEFLIPVQEYRVSGRRMKHLRTVAHLGSQGLTVKELPPGAVPLEEILRVSGDWLQGRIVKNRELRYLTRPPDYEDGLGVRRFYCFKEGRLVGYVFFDPFFLGGRCLGYCANILRRARDARPSGLLDYTILQALEQFKAEGLPWLALGLAPLHDLQPHPGDEALLRIFGKLLYRWGGSLYNFRELAFHKSRYRGEARKLYFCKRGLGLLATVGLSLRATNLL